MEGVDIDYSKLPEHLVGGFRRYIEHGVRPGQFICAVIVNDLLESYGRADSISIARMSDIVGFVYNQMPSKSHGSPAKLDAWIAARAGGNA